MLPRRGIAPRERQALVLSIALFGIAAAPSIASAQAWVLPAGEGTVQVIHQFIRSDVHLDKAGIGTREFGREVVHAINVEGTYGLFDRLEVDVAAVWLATEWTGTGEGHGPVDTGTFHQTLQDFRFTGRYQLAAGRVAVAPFVAFGVPSHAYETRGHSAFGRDLKDLQFGVSVGRRFGCPSASGYFHSSVAYAITQGVEGVDLDLNRTTGDFEIGSSIHRSIQIKGFAYWQVMKGGLQLKLEDHKELQDVHDRFARASYLQLGGGTSFDLGSRATLSIDVFATASGRNVHALRAVVSGITWRFGGGFKIRPETPGKS
jgi:hypothetical protein